MSDEELERLAAAMKNMKPSDAARKTGMEAAMAAFDTEFAADKEIVHQNTTTRQGSAIEERPMGQTKGSPIMSKFKSILNMPPRAYMMVGSCAAALMFAMVIIPPSVEDAMKVEQFGAIATEIDSTSPAPAPQAGGQTVEKAIPNVTKMESRRLVKSPSFAADEEVDISVKIGKAVTVRDRSDVSSQQKPSRTRRLEPQPERMSGFVAEGDAEEKFNQSVSELLEGADKIIQEMDEKELRLFDGNRDRFETYEPNPVTSVKETPVSTFSVDVDTASYTFLRASINRGHLPQPGSIRLEEMINYFPYDYEGPTSAAEPFNANVTVTPSPWNADTQLMHIGIKGYVPPASEKPRSNVVFLIDTSGSMRAQNKLPLLINSFKLLLNTMDEEDTVSIVTYAGSAGTVLEPTPANEKSKIKAALNRLQAGGSTAGAAGLELAYLKAQESFDEDGINRVFLATDGDFNVGFSSPDEMKSFVEKKRKTGIFLSVLGFGHGNYNDALMQSLAQNGNGVAAYIDSLAEANKVLADESGSALIPIAKDVKIQVEFNPATVAEYRLIGYETRALKREDFNNDAVDAGDINSGHTVTAIYEMTPVGSKAITVDDLRYASAERETAANDSDEFAFIKIRHKLPNANKSTLQSFPIGPRQVKTLREANNDMRFASAVAAFGQKLRDDTQLTEYGYGDIVKMASGAKGDDEQGYRAEFIQLVKIVQGLEE